MSWSSRINSKIFSSKDQFDTMVNTALNDPLVNATSGGLRRKVRDCLLSSILILTRRDAEQLFTILFNHLTTSITDIEIQLSKVTIQRNGSTKDFVAYRKYMEEVERSITTAGKKKKPTENRESSKIGVVACHNEWANLLTYKVPGNKKEESSVEKFVKSLHWTDMKYFMEWKANMKIMEVTSYDRAHRVSDRRGERFVVMSGLAWNKQSRAKERDWAPTVAAITLETALVENYRENLLRMSDGAYALRKELHDFFLSFTTIHYETHPTTNEIMRTKTWDFPDGYGLLKDVDVPNDSDDESAITGMSSRAGDARATDSTGLAVRTGRTGSRTVRGAKTVRGGKTAETKTYNAEAMMKALNKVNPIVETSRRRNEGVQNQIEHLAKHKYLQSSDPNALKGSLETLAYQCLATLWRVSHSSVRLLDRNGGGGGTNVNHR